MADAVETGLYLLTPTHVGAGQSAGAIDLPIMRDVQTGFPVIPSTALKGVARDLFEGPRSERRDNPEVLALFGSRPPSKQSPGEGLTPGDLIFTDGQLLAFPVRSLSAAFYWVTCPLVIARWRRLRDAWGLPKIAVDVPPDRAVATSVHTGALVLEDHVVNPGGGAHPTLRTLAEAWSKLLPEGDDVAKTLVDRLVCVPDADFALLVQRCTSVQARVQLTDGKTTDKWEDQEGNLWYEETLPSDCLFSVLIASRRDGGAVEVGKKLGEGGLRVQIGGNETVGQGMSWWRPAKGGADGR